MVSKTSKRRNRTQKRQRSQKRRQQRGGSSGGWMREPTSTSNLSSARYYPLEPQQTPAGQVGDSARNTEAIRGGSRRYVNGGRRSRRQRFSLRRRQNGGGLFTTGGFADLASAYSAGTGTTPGVPSHGVQFATVPPITASNTNPNGSVVSKQV